MGWNKGLDRVGAGVEGGVRVGDGVRVKFKVAFRARVGVGIWVWVRVYG